MANGIDCGGADGVEFSVGFNGCASCCEGDADEFTTLECLPLHAVEDEEEVAVAERLHIERVPVGGGAKGSSIGATAGREGHAFGQ